MGGYKQKQSGQIKLSQTNMLKTLILVVSGPNNSYSASSGSLDGLQRGQVREYVTYISIFDAVIVHVLGAGSILANIFVLGQLVDENLAAIPSVSLREAELSLRLLDGHG